MLIVATMSPPTRPSCHPFLLLSLRGKDVDSVTLETAHALPRYPQLTMSGARRHAGRASTQAHESQRYLEVNVEPRRALIVAFRFLIRYPARLRTRERDFTKIMAAERSVSASSPDKCDARRRLVASVLEINSCPLPFWCRAWTLSQQLSVLARARVRCVSQTKCRRIYMLTTEACPS